MRYKIRPHRLTMYDGFWRWNAKRRSKDYRQWCIELGAQFDNLWLDESARRTQKTGSWLVILNEFAHRMSAELGRGINGLIAIPMKTKIGGVLVPNIKKIFQDAPPGYGYEYHTTGQGEHEHLYIPACESRFTLAGLDKNPDALRGPFRDVVLFTEGGYMKDLYSTYVSEVQPQLQGLPHAFTVFESSKPKVPDHDWNTHFKPDAQIRGCVTHMTIYDNTELTNDDIEDEIRKSGGRDSAECKRELFNEVDPNLEERVVPHFDEAVHVVDPADYPQPQYALAHEGYDPGTTDPLGYVALYLDYLRQQIVIQHAFMKPSMSTGEFVNEQARPTARRLWGTDLETIEGREHLRDEGTPILLQRIAGGQETPDGKVWSAPHESLTYWDENAWSLKANPFSRISDTHARFILDLNRDYALNVRAAEKEPGSAEADLEYLDELFRRRHEDGRPLIVILNNGNTLQLIQQLRSGVWKMRDDVHKMDWVRSKLLGHLDCIAALKYVVRDVKWKRNPNPPAFPDYNRPGLMVPEHLKRGQNAVTLHTPNWLSSGPRVRTR